MLQTICNLDNLTYCLRPCYLSLCRVIIRYCNRCIQIRQQNRRVSAVKIKSKSSNPTRPFQRTLYRITKPPSRASLAKQPPFENTREIRFRYPLSLSTNPCFCQGRLPTNLCDSLYEFNREKCLGDNSGFSPTGGGDKSRHVRCLLTVDTIGKRPRGDSVTRTINPN